MFASSNKVETPPKYKLNEGAVILNSVSEVFFLLEVVWKLNFTDLLCISTAERAFMLQLFGCLSPSGITQQKAVNMQSRLISFPRSLVQKKRAPRVNKSTVCCRKCDLSADGWASADELPRGFLLIFARELTRLRARLHLAKKYFCLIHSLGKTARVGVVRAS